MSKVPVGTLQHGLGCPVRAEGPGVMGASEAAGPVATLSVGHPVRTPGRHGGRPRDGSQSADSAVTARRVWRNKADSRSLKIKSMG